MAGVGISMCTVVTCLLTRFACGRKSDTLTTTEVSAVSLTLKHQALNFADTIPMLLFHCVCYSMKDIVDGARPNETLLSCNVQIYDGAETPGSFVD
jgi:hypothetical protein